VQAAGAAIAVQRASRLIDSGTSMRAAKWLLMATLACEPLALQNVRYWDDDVQVTSMALHCALVQTCVMSDVLAPVQCRSAAIIACLQKKSLHAWQLASTLVE
jgi:hypothetical protein